MARILFPTLKKFRERKNGIPSSLPAFENCRDRNPTEEEEQLAIKQWDGILDAMIFSFEQLTLHDEGEDQFWLQKPILDLSDHPEDKGKMFIPVRWKRRGKLDQEGLRRHRQRIQDGLNLFAQYYRDLWI